MVNFLIAIKSGTIENLTTGYNFTVSALNNPSVLIKMIFFYQNGSNILLNTELNNQWVLLINNYNLPALICSASYKKRGINIKEPFKASSIIEFSTNCEMVDKILVF